MALDADTRINLGVVFENNRTEEVIDSIPKEFFEYKPYALVAESLKTELAQLKEQPDLFSFESPEKLRAYLKSCLLPIFVVPRSQEVEIPDPDAMDSLLKRSIEISAKNKGVSGVHSYEMVSYVLHEFADFLSGKGQILVDSFGPNLDQMDPKQDLLDLLRLVSNPQFPQFEGILAKANFPKISLTPGQALTAPEIAQYGAAIQHPLVADGIIDLHNWIRRDWTTAMKEAYGPMFNEVYGNNLLNGNNLTKITSGLELLKPVYEHLGTPAVYSGLFQPLYEQTSRDMTGYNLRPLGEKIAIAIRCEQTAVTALQRLGPTMQQKIRIKTM